MEEQYVLIKTGKYYSEKTNDFTALKEEDAKKFLSNEVFKKKKKLEKKSFGNILVKIAGK